jgi:hypothetical protein
VFLLEAGRHVEVSAPSWLKKRAPVSHFAYRSRHLVTRDEEIATKPRLQAAAPAVMQIGPDFSSRYGAWNGVAAHQLLCPWIIHVEGGDDRPNSTQHDQRTTVTE